MSTPQQGFLLVADITGYTMYLSQSELEHAQSVLQALLELLIDNTRPPLVISRLAGDAVISYALRDSAPQGQTFIEMLENTYVAFRRAIELMVMNNTCRCNACANIPSLDLKFFLHYGTFGLQRLGGHDELVGSDVNLIHRLLKNHVTEQTGFRAYTIFTNTAIRQLGLEQFCEKLVGHREQYEHLGEVAVWVQDMHPIWEEKRAATRITIPPGQIALRVEGEVAMPPELVWDYLSQPEFRTTLMGSDRQRVLNRAHGRVAPGSVFQCFHGDRVTTQTIVQWQPFEQMTSEDLTPIAKTSVLVDFRLIPTEKGTLLVQTISKATAGPLFGRLLCNVGLPRMAKQARRDIEAFRQRIEADLAVRGGGRPAAGDISPATIGEAVAASLSGV
ncbi:MAG: DUF2652 domain-containing protein [Chloroflexota bacterium]